MRRAAVIFRLGVKELWSLARDPVMLTLIGFTFTVSIYVAATAMPEPLHHAALAVVDEDRVAVHIGILDDQVTTL